MRGTELEEKNQADDVLQDEMGDFMEQTGYNDLAPRESSAIFHGDVAESTVFEDEND
jgi:hypothetical protein